MREQAQRTGDVIEIVPQGDDVPWGPSRNRPDLSGIIADLPATELHRRLAHVERGCEVEGPVVVNGEFGEVHLVAEPAFRLVEEYGTGSPEIGHPQYVFALRHTRDDAGACQRQSVDRAPTDLPAGQR